MPNNQLLDKSLRVMMNDETYNRIKTIARRDGVSMGDVVRDCIYGLLNEREKWELPKFGEQVQE